MKKTAIIKGELTLIVMSAVMLLSFIACKPKVQQQYYIDNNKESEQNDQLTNDSVNAAVADSSLFTYPTALLQIEYRGDVARLYAEGRLIDDNFYNGRPFQYALWRLPKGCRQLELRILPLQKDMPVYFPREADVQTPGEEVKSVTIQPVQESQ